jgi:hypothetical protein
MERALVGNALQVLTTNKKRIILLSVELLRLN